MFMRMRNKVRQTISVVIVLSILLFTSMSSIADINSFDLLGYMKKHKITSRSEFIEVLLENRIDVSNTTFFAYPLGLAEVDFSYEIDNVRDEIITNTIYMSTTGSNTSGNVVKEVYSNTGKLIYTLSVSGTFSRSGLTCTTISASGSFQPASSSTWRSTPVITSGNITTNIAYARISGTASSQSQSRSYQLTLKCTSSGELSSSFVG